MIYSDEMGIFSKDTDSETEKKAVTPYQFELADAYSSDSDELSEDECASSDEEKLYELVLGLGDTEKRAPRYIVKVFITIINIITILHVNHKNMLHWFY